MEIVKTDTLIMTKAQLQAEILRCEYCEEKPCKEACPSHLFAGGFYHGGVPGEYIGHSTVGG